MRELSWRYICIYEILTGNKFEFPSIDLKPHDRIVANAKIVTQQAQEGSLSLSATASG